MRIATGLGLFTIGFLLGQQSIIFGYDPAELENEGRILAANAYMLACVKAGKTNSECRIEASQWYDELSHAPASCSGSTCRYPRRSYLK